ncbi:MAG: SRPBCC family protein [Bacteroidota bacterium]|jgi:hypothetical protein
MKLFKLFLSFFLVTGAIMGVSLFFPNTYRIDRSVTIHKPVSDVFAYMSNLRNWEQWSMWNKDIDSTLNIFYRDRSDSLGGVQYFSGDRIGTGRFKIVEYENEQRLGYNLYMNKGDVSANGTFTFNAVDTTTTELHWIDSGYVGYNPFFRFMLPNKIKSTSEAFDAGLSRIQKMMEASNAR